MKRARRGDAGFTLIEVLTYLALFTFFMASLVGAEVLASRVNKGESAIVEALAEVDRLFARLAEDCDRASDVSRDLVQSGEVVLSGAAVYAIDPARRTILRDGVRLMGDVAAARFERDPKSPRLLKVSVRVRAGPHGEPIDRTFERSFYLPNAGRSGAARTEPGGRTEGRHGSF